MIGYALGLLNGMVLYDMMWCDVMINHSFCMFFIIMFYID